MVLNKRAIIIIAGILLLVGILWGVTTAANVTGSVITSAVIAPGEIENRMLGEDKKEEVKDDAQNSG